MKYFISMWRARPVESRKAVIGELSEMANGWSQGDQPFETQEDLDTLQLVVSMLRDLDNEKTNT